MQGKILKTVKNIRVGCSEAAMYMGVCDKTADVDIISYGDGHLMGQLIINGKRFSAPLLLSECGIIQNGLDLSYVNSAGEYKTDILI